MEVVECMSNIISTNKKLYSVDPAPVKIRIVTGANETFQTSEPLRMCVHAILAVNAKKGLYVYLNQTASIEMTERESNGYRHGLDTGR